MTSRRTVQRKFAPGTMFVSNLKTVCLVVGWIKVAPTGRKPLSHAALIVRNHTVTTIPWEMMHRFLTVPEWEELMGFN